MGRARAWDYHCNVRFVSQALARGRARTQSLAADGMDTHFAYLKAVGECKKRGLVTTGNSPG